MRSTEGLLVIDLESKVVPYSIMSVGHRGDSDFLAVSPQMTLPVVIYPVVGCHYFSPTKQLLSQPKRSTLLAGTKLYHLVTEAHLSLIHI